MARIARFFAWAAEFFFGSDVFVSYSRADALEYAGKLGSELTDRKVTCYLDQWESVPGKELPLSLRLQLARSSMLVLVGSSQAATSAAVEKELAAFKSTGRPILGVDVEGALRGATWFAHLAGAPLAPESAEALGAGVPSASVVGRIVTALGFRTRNRRLRTAFWATALAMVSIVIAGGGAVLWLRARAASAIREEGVARAATEAQRAVAVSRRVAAQAAALRATTPDLALLLAISAMKASETYEARSLLLDAVTKYPQLTGVRGVDDLGVRALTVDPTGRVLAAAAGRHLALVDLQSHRPLRCPFVIPNAHDISGDKPFPEFFRKLTFSPDGKWILGTGWFQSYLWDVVTGSRIALPGRVAAFTSNNEVAEVGHDESIPGSGRRVSVWNVARPESPRHVRDIDVGAVVTDVVVSPSGSLAAFAVGDHDAVLLWDLRANRRLGQPIVGHAELVSSMAFSPDDTLLATADLKETVRIWETGTGRLWAGPLHAWGIDAPGKSVVFSRDGETLAVGSADGRVSLFGIRERFETSGHHELRLAGPHHDASWRYEGQSNGEGAVAFGVGSDEVASGAASGQLAFWRVADGSGFGRSFPHGGSLLLTAFSPDGDTFASASGGDIRMRDARDGADRGVPLSQPKGAGDVVGLAFSRDGASVLAAYREDALGVWDRQARRLVFLAPMPTGFSLDRSAISPHGTRAFASSNEGSGLLWNVGQPAAKPVELESGVATRATFASFGGRDDALVTGYADGAVRIWDLDQPAHPKATLRLHDGEVVAATLVRDGAAIAVIYSDGLLVVSPLVAGGPAWSSQITPSPITSGAFSTGGSLAAVIYNDDLGRLVLWDLEANASLVDVASANHEPVFGADGSRLLRSGLNVEIWDLSGAALRSAGCSLVGRNLTRAERQRFALPDSDARLCPTFEPEPECPQPNAPLKPPT